MNETMADNGLDLQQYVDEVRRGLSDLDTETREGLTEGLGADLTELVEERGSGALPPPDEYAAELRAAAGLSPATRRPLLQPDWWRPAWEIAVAALPAWWIARAWVWVMLLHLVLWDTQSWGNDVPWLPTQSWGLGVVLWVVATVVSIQIGRGRLWPGGAHRSTAALVAVAVLNVASLAVGILALEHVDTTLDTRSMERRELAHDVNPAVITYQDQQSCTLRVFDADGKRLRGVEVQDQSGRVLPMRNRDC